MSSHADCTHEKTKAARAACRAGKAPSEPRGDMPKASPTKLREKASEAASKLGDPKAEGEPATRATVISGFCSGGKHDTCPGGGRQWHCDCDCHTVHAE